MEDEYYEVTSEVDAREVLRYLNHLGIRNISGEVLKHFITDLKKLIKYDLQQRYKIKEQEDEKPGPERLHSATTFCSRIRSKTHASGDVRCSREFPSLRRPFTVRNVQSAPVLSQTKAPQEEKPMRRACSCRIADKKSEPVSKESRVTTTTLSNNLIKVPRQPAKKKCDPVSLYHYYTSLWAKYKPNVPGENNWADLRWHIRQKMAGSIVQSEHRIPDHPLKSKDSGLSKKT